jgi:AcrR family transcriptional regulator
MGMSAEKQAIRQAEIEAAAFEVLAERGYRRASMLEIAKRAGASNQTLYSWYGDKQSLFERLIERNGQSVVEVLSAEIEDDADLVDVLRRLGTALLAFTTGEKAIIVNRAAVADATETGRLAVSIDTAARDVMMCQIEAIMKKLIKSNIISKKTDPADGAESYVSLLFGEIPLRQAFGRIAPLSKKTIQARADRACSLTLRLYRD